MVHKFALNGVKPNYKEACVEEQEEEIDKTRNDGFAGGTKNLCIYRTNMVIVVVTFLLSFSPFYLSAS